MISCIEMNQLPFTPESTIIANTQEIKEQEEEVKPKRHYNKNKYKEVERETAYVEPEEIVKNTFLAHPNLKKKDLVRVMVVLIKNVSISVLDIVLWNSVEKLYNVSKDFVRLLDKPISEIDPNKF
ncbi:MAG: hypothetical protein EZS28_007611 [Streblomastix strix]|uniref:Uncharacterized protein n=1 Tax=Streblomastix strix TaxID=222440 RepID=A0A5J4WPF7_9EUKA|nr:MAG: hypothetical protein EZS28_007611 [Streblomastix strix]